jgi:hypothetical protein
MWVKHFFPCLSVLFIITFLAGCTTYTPDPEKYLVYYDKHKSSIVNFSVYGIEPSVKGAVVALDCDKRTIDGVQNLLGDLRPKDSQEVCTLIFITHKLTYEGYFIETKVSGPSYVSTNPRTKRKERRYDKTYLFRKKKDIKEFKNEDQSGGGWIKKITAIPAYSHTLRMVFFDIQEEKITAVRVIHNCVDTSISDKEEATALPPGRQAAEVILGAVKKEPR